MTEPFAFERFLAVFGIGLRIFAATLGVYKVTAFPETMNRTEKAGLGLMTGGALLTAPLGLNPHAPTEGWGPVVVYLGLVLFLFGRTMRDRKHAIANKKAREEADAYLKARGKL